MSIEQTFWGSTSATNSNDAPELPIKRHGQPIKTWWRPLDEIRAQIPRFEYGGFGYGENKNEKHRTIIRQPLPNDTRTIPVAIAGKGYHLIQHTDVFDWFVAGLHVAGADLEEIKAHLWLSEYGEWMRLSAPLNRYQFSPPDDHPMHYYLQITNSVDKTRALTVKLDWVRMVCKNGQLDFSEHDTLRILHNNQSVNSRNISLYISRKLSDALNIKSEIEMLYDWSLDEEEITEFIDNDVLKKWGVKNAARVYSIAMSGIDGKVHLQTEKRPPSKLVVSKNIKVPGACAPVRNRYHLKQALIWVAQRQVSIELQETRLAEVMSLISELVV